MMYLTAQLVYLQQLDSNRKLFNATRTVQLVDAHVRWLKFNILLRNDVIFH